jgi:hypothetical protein
VDTYTVLTLYSHCTHTVLTLVKHETLRCPRIHCTYSQILKTCKKTLHPRPSPLTREECDLAAYRRRKGPEWDRIKSTLRTLANGGVIVVVGHLRMRSLFNGPTIAKSQSYLTGYGGVNHDRNNFNLLNAHAFPRSHGRKCESPGMIQNGRPLADLFPTCTPSFMDEQLKLEVRHRTRLTVRARGVSRHVRDFITNTGCGYFANCSLVQGENNVRVRAVAFNGDSSSQMFFTTRDIMPFEEILSSYNNDDGAIV